METQHHLYKVEWYVQGQQPIPHQIRKVLRNSSCAVNSRLSTELGGVATAEN